MVEFTQRWEKVGNFIGSYKRSIDEKGRLQLPPKLLGEEEGPFYLLRGFDDCLSVYPSSRFGKLLERLSSLDYFDSKARKFVRLALAEAEKLETDAHGRIALRRELLSKTPLDCEALLIGCLDHFEIWDPKAYENYMGSGESLEELGNAVSAEGRDGRP